MSSFESTHAFIVRIWSEPQGTEKKGVEWRGVIEHVASGQQKYFRDLEEMAEFVHPYLIEMGVEEKLWKRLRQKLKPLIR